MSLGEPPASIRRAVWEGSIPVQILLDPGESRVFDNADPFYIQLPRVSYLPLFYPQLYTFFESFLIDKDTCKPSEAWLEFEGVPLKWHWPIGLLYDLLTGRDPTYGTTNLNTEDEHRLPWTLTLHYNDYPHEHLMRLDNPSALQDAFINSTKEADYLRNGNSRAVMSLSMADSAKFWQSIETHNFDSFWSINEKLLSSSGYPIRHIPIKVYLPSAAKVVQKLIPPYLSNKSEPITVGAAMRLMVPELFLSTRANIIAKPVLHGVVLPLSAPLLELMREAVYPDGFLHIAVTMMS
ncbi:autophagy protein Apg5-domain-containing protein [Kalaharituber pfeilii]|nr:autophagy protein Apg5-domain-containing protein [Kalaharituber pfeilii]